ncbi:hypothetical protein ABIA00_003393 [Bradyrhizobium ottawaense]
MVSGRSRELREEFPDVGARHGRALLFLLKLARSNAKRVPINVGMRISSVSIFDVYPRTIEGAFCLILVSRNSGRRRLRMPTIPGAVPSGSPVQCMRGVSKMYKSQYDLMPLRWAIDGACASMASPQTSKRRRAMRLQAQKLAGANSFWLVQPPRRHLPIHRARGINRTRVQSNDRSVAQRPAARSTRAVPSSDRAWRRISAFIGGSANSEFT